MLPGDELAFAGEKFRVEMGPGEPDLEPDDELENQHTEMIELPPKLEENFLEYQLEPLKASNSDVEFLDDE